MGCEDAAPDPHHPKQTCTAHTLNKAFLFGLSLKYMRYMAGYLQRALWWMSWHCKEKEGVVSLSPSLVRPPSPGSGTGTEACEQIFGLTALVLLYFLPRSKTPRSGELSRAKRCCHFLSIFFKNKKIKPNKNQPVEVVCGLQRPSWLWTLYYHAA